jgi:hypothetical protein
MPGGVKKKRQIHPDIQTQTPNKHSHSRSCIETHGSDAIMDVEENISIGMHITKWLCSKNTFIPKSYMEIVMEKTITFPLNVTLITTRTSPIFLQDKNSNLRTTAVENERRKRGLPNE